MISITFQHDYRLDEASIKLVLGTIGVYFIFLNELMIPYPFGSSKLIYIGLSESRQNSVGRRLRAHLAGQSGNVGIMNYAERYDVRFSYHSEEVLRNLGLANLYEIESVFLSDFCRYRGAFPLCNNQAGLDLLRREVVLPSIEVDWAQFS